MDAPSKSSAQAPTSSEALYERLLGQILSDERPAGSKLPPERALAQELGTNRSTLREALRRLEQARLLTPRQGSGVVVADFREVGTLELLGSFLMHGKDPAEKARVVIDLLEPRAHVVEYLVALVGRRRRRDAVERLAPHVQAAREAEEARDATDLLSAQDEFMNGLVELADSLLVRWVANPLLNALGDMLGKRPELLLFTPSFADLGDELLRCFEAGDAGAAVRAARAFHAEVDDQLRGALASMLPEPDDDG